LAYAQQWFQSKQSDINILKDLATEEQKSLFVDIDQEISRTRSEIDKLQKQLERESDPDTRNSLTEEKDKWETTAS
jgi:predicted  nucleic acid-binding Zn-ribbon protein